MRKIILLHLASLLALFSYSQIFVSSDPTDTVREKSAAFEVKSRTGGFLPPRLSTAERKAIANPAQGLLVFDTTKQMFYGFVKGFGWRPFLMGIDTALLSDAYSPSIPELQPGDNFGETVTIKGNIAVVGAPGTDFNGKFDQGAIYVFRKNGQQWDKIQRIFAPDGAAGDRFGSHVTMTSSYVFVAAFADDVGENIDQGSAYAFKIESDTLKFHQKLTSVLAASYDRFGSYINASANHLFIGASDDDIASNTDQGSTYYFALENGTWVEKQKIIQDSLAGAFDHFGFGISIKGERVALGHEISSSGSYGYSHNSVFLYEFENGSWQRKIEIKQPDDLSGKTDGFGYATYLTDSTLTIGAWLKDEPVGNKDRGVMYLYKKNGNSWSYIKKFYPDDPNPSDNYGDYFGASVSGDGKYMVAGHGHEDLSLGQIDKGAFFLYEWVGTEWILKRKVSSATPTTLDLFGSHFGISDENIIVSAANANGSGKVYFYSIED